MDPNYKTALNGKGFATAKLGNYTQAIQYFDKALLWIQMIRLH